MNKTELKLHIYGDAVLRKKSLSVKAITAAEKTLLNRMAEIMYSSGGIGLAAPQVGISKQMIVIDIGDGLRTFINPKIKKGMGSSVMQEGCLSVPNVYVDVKRPSKVYVEALDSSNSKISFWADGLFGRAIQHEIDHLNGKLIIDYVHFVRRLAIKRKFMSKRAEVAS